MRSPQHRDVPTPSQPAVTTDPRSALPSPARENFRRQWKIEGTAPIEVSASASHEQRCLQAADFFLWALQRVYTKGEDRYLRFLWPRVRLVHDADDRRKSPTGAYYSEKTMLTAESIRKVPGI